MTEKITFKEKMILSISLVAMILIIVGLFTLATIFSHEQQKETEMQTAKLDYWSLIVYGKADTYALQGRVTGHPKLADGGFITTSPIKEINTSENYAITLNTRYELGEPDPEFARLYSAVHLFDSALDSLHQNFNPE